MATFWDDNFLRVFVSAFQYVDCILLYSFPKIYINGFQIKIYRLI